MDSIISQFVKALIEFIGKLQKQIICRNIEDELTVKLLKAWRIDPKNRVVLMNKKALVKEIDDLKGLLDNIDFGNAEVIFAEYDPDKDEIVQLSCSKRAEEFIFILEKHDGIVILE